MINFISKENWDIAARILKRTFPWLTDDDLDYIEGNEDVLFRKLKERTGKDRSELREFLENSRR